jgi:preprotein translocase subunit SecA
MEGQVQDSHKSQRPTLTSLTQGRMAEIKRLEPEMADLSDEEPRRTTGELKASLRAN